MIGIGTDIIAIERIAEVIQRSGDRLAQRILSAPERQRLGDIDARRLAKAWAAKEAVAKALGTGFRLGIGWQDIVVGRDDLGRPTVRLEGAAAERCQQLGGRQVLLSISDERSYVVAFAAIT